MTLGEITVEPLAKLNFAYKQRQDCKGAPPKAPLMLAGGGG